MSGEVNGRSAVLATPVQALIAELTAQRDAMAHRAATLAMQLGSANEIIGRLQAQLAEARVAKPTPDDMPAEGG